jgi:hypothetical protein
MVVTIFIEGNVPSLKNSKIKSSKGIFPSSTVRKYLQKVGVKKYSTRKKEVEDYATRPNLWRLQEEKFRILQTFPPPYVIGFHFVRGTKHAFDFNNASQICLDLMTAHDFIPDDSMDYTIPLPFRMNGKWFSYDKTNPGVFIKLYIP